MSIVDRLIRRLAALLVRGPGANHVIGDLEESRRRDLDRGMHPRRARARYLSNGLASAAVLARERARRRNRAICRWNGIGDLVQDIRVGFRGLRRARLFTALAVTTIALGVGANAAIFGVVKSALLDRLPYRNADTLVRVYGGLADGTVRRADLSTGATADYIRRNRSFASAATFFPQTFEVVHAAPDGARSLTGALVDHNLLPTLGVRTALGRGITAEDIESDAPVALLGWRTWQRELAGDSAAVGRTMRLNSDTYTVIGVLPRGFVAPPGPADVWFGFDATAGFRDPASARTARKVGLVARLEPETDIARARRELDAITRDLAREHPDTDAGNSVEVIPLRDSMLGDTRRPLLMLMAGALLVLAVAGANLAGATLARTVERRREFAARRALGAGTGRLTRQLLTETLLLVSIGVAIGVALAALGLETVRHVARPVLPYWVELEIDVGVLLVMAGVAMTISALVALAPARAAARTDIQRTLREAAGAVTGGLRAARMRGLIVAAQMAVCLSLLVGAGLLSRSLLALASTPLGFEPEGVLTLSVQGPIPAPDAARARFFAELEDAISRLPGVVDVGSTSRLPGGSALRTALSVEGWAPDAERPLVAEAVVSDDYFRALGIPLSEGRTFDSRDVGEAPTAVVIGESLARRYWPRGGAVGSRIGLGARESAATVVGVVGDVRSDPAADYKEPVVYRSTRQDPLRSSRVYAVRAAVPPASLVPAIREQLHALDVSVPLRDVATLEQRIGARLVTWKLPAILVNAFAVLALVLASFGVYALFAGMVAAAGPELRLRMALGSTPGALGRLILRRGARWILAGLLVGLVGVTLVGRLVQGLLYQVSPIDPLTLALALGTLGGCAALALLIPVRRAVRAAGLG